MVTRRIGRQIEQLLKTIERAVESSDWTTVSRVAADVLAMAPEHADALAYREAAARAMEPLEGRPPRTRARWTADEEAFLRAEAGRRRVREIARELGRTPDSVRHRAYALGLSLRTRPRGVTRQSDGSSPATLAWQEW